ncbi:HD domain-containing protein [Bacteroidota bacterium]
MTDFPVFSLDEPAIAQLAVVAKQTNLEAYLVGGFVRDKILGRESKDIDVVVIGDGIEFAQQFQKRFYPDREVAVFKNFGTAMLKAKDCEVEFVGARKESYSRDSRKPTVSPGTLREDQERRDFTVNALGISLNPENFGQLIDPFDGLKDMEAKVLRTPLNPDITFDDDPLRMIRAIRFSAQLGFSVHPETFEAIRKFKDRIKIVSAERIAEELNKIMLSPKPSIGWMHLHKSGLLKLILPELEAMKGVEVVQGKAHKDNFLHTLQVIDQGAEETNELWLRWAILLHDIGKPPCKRFIPGEGWTFHGHEDKGSRMVSRIFSRLKMPLNEKLRYVEKLVAMHHRPKSLAEDGVTDSAIRRLIVDAGDELDDLFILCRADMTTKHPDKLAKYRRNLERVRELMREVEERDALRNWQPPVSGEDIMAYFGIGPSRQVGQIKVAIREAILDGNIPNSREAAMQLMQELGASLGLEGK